MDKWSIRRAKLFHLTLMHVSLVILHLLGSNLGHPYFKFLNNFNVLIQVLVLSISSLIIYMIVGMAYAMLNPNKKKLEFVLEWTAILFALILMTIYAVTYFISLSLYNRDIMLVYAVANPWFGTYMYKLADEGLYSLWWMLSTVIPSIGYYIGVKFYLVRKRREIV